MLLYTINHTSTVSSVPITFPGGIGSAGGGEDDLSSFSLFTGLPPAVAREIISGYKGLHYIH